MDTPYLFAAALTEVFDRLDWHALGLHYCFEGGENFFDEVAREKLFEAQVGFASEVVETLQAQQLSETGRSLYVGAALSELGPMLGESILTKREVLAFSLDNPETRELNQCLAKVARQLDQTLPGGI